MTIAHEVIGTPQYMAPEQLWGHEVDARTDVYAIGMTLYECLTGEVPYTGGYPEVLVRVSNATEPPKLRDKRADLPAALATVIENALEKEASARFQTAAELGRALLASSGLTARCSSLLPGPIENGAGQHEGSEDEAARAIHLVRKKAHRAAAGSSASSRGPGPGEAPSHRRQFVLAPYVTPVLVKSPTGETGARSEEISEEGMLVVSSLSLPLGAALQLQFASPGSGDIIVVAASVRWTREGRGRTAIGVEFVDPPVFLRGAVAGYIATLRAAQQ